MGKEGRVEGDETTHSTSLNDRRGKKVSFSISPRSLFIEMGVLDVSSHQKLGVPEGGGGVPINRYELPQNHHR